MVVKDRGRGKTKKRARKAKPKAKQSSNGAKQHPGPFILDPNLAKALSHPLRVAILAQISHRSVLSPVEFSRLFGDDLNIVAHHFRELEKYGCVELAFEKPRRGAHEHFYRSPKRPILQDADWTALPKSIQASVSATTLRDLIERIVQAFEADTFDARDNSYLTWTPFFVDEEGFDELSAIAESAFKQSLEVQVKATERMTKSGEESLAATMALACFESPKAGPAD